MSGYRESIECRLHSQLAVAWHNLSNILIIGVFFYAVAERLSEVNPHLLQDREEVHNSARFYPRTSLFYGEQVPCWVENLGSIIERVDWVVGVEVELIELLHHDQLEDLEHHRCRQKDVDNKEGSSLQYASTAVWGVQVHETRPIFTRRTPEQCHQRQMEAVEVPQLVVVVCVCHLFWLEQKHGQYREDEINQEKQYQYIQQWGKWKYQGFDDLVDTI